MWRDDPGSPVDDPANRPPRQPLRRPAGRSRLRRLRRKRQVPTAAGPWAGKTAFEIPIPSGLAWLYARGPLE